jgi:aspartyl-tRNA(Asn)/glutamyl-tRNA(Gln) amidotransferase subunit A
MPDWSKVSAAQLGAAYRNGRVTPTEVLEQVLARCTQLNPILNAIVTLDSEGARRDAVASEARWRAGSPLGALDGIPLTVKDSILVRGLRTTWGSRRYADFVPERDELPVARLRAAGALIVGKTNVPEFTLQGYTDNLLFGPTRNPWDPELTPGGSSGGAVAAVAAGLAPLALCTDGGGSIRRPASHTGLVGLKPSRGRVPRCDGFPAILLDYEVVGPIARCVEDVVLVMRALSESDARDPSSSAFEGRPFEIPESLRRRRILYAPRFGDAPVDREVAASVAAAARVFERLGHSVEEAARFDLAEPLNEAWPVISQVGLAWLLGAHGASRDELSTAIESMAESGRKIPATRLFDALDATRAMRGRVAGLFADYDFLLTPTAAALPWPVGETHPAAIDGRPVGPRGHAVFTAFVNAAGLSAINLPCAPSAGGLPIGFQLIAPAGGDGLLCAIAVQFERAEPWAHRWPALCASEIAA